MPPLHQAIHSALKDCLKLRRGEHLLILADDPLNKLACQFYDRAKSISDKTTLFILPEIPNHGYEPPQDVASLLSRADAAVILTHRSLSHTKARKSASRNGTRIASLPNVSGETLSRTMTGYYRELIKKSQKIADILTIGRSAHLTTPAGTDVTFSLARMKGYADTGMIHESGQFTNLPAGEGSAAPVQGSAQGTLIVDGSFPEVGRIKTPIRISVRDGQAVRIAGGSEAEKMRCMLRPFGKMGRNIAEVGIGTNAKAKMTGCTLEDEKVLGNVHVALGNNVSFGGKVNVGCHFDCVVLNATLVIDGQTIVKNGELQV